MSRIQRLSVIARVFFRYRLDSFVDIKRLPPALRILLEPTRLLPQPDEPRAVRLRRAFEELGPIFVKFGQLLSTRPDLVPGDICDELSELQDNVPPYETERFVAILEQALGKPVDELFLSFERTPLASASVAQVHAARLHDGRDVVVKAIRPRVDKLIRQDISLLYLLASIVEKHQAIGRRLRPREVVEDYEQTIFDELDLQREAANTSSLRRNFENSELLYIPEVHWPLTKENVMVTERIYGTPVTDIKSLKTAGIDFKVLAHRGVEIFFTQVFEHNFFHADMHPGNIFVDTSNPDKPSYLAVDCAIMGTLSKADQHYLARNLIAIFRRDYQQVAELHVLSGWVPENTPVNEFAAAIRTVSEPFFEKPLKDISLAMVLISLFRTAQRFDMEVQPSLVLLQKTLLNIEGLGRQLYPELDLWATAHPFLERWLQNHFNPGTLLDQLKRHGPEWLEQFPQVPQLLFSSLEQLQQRDRLPASKRTGRTKKTFSGSRLHWLGAAALGGALGMSYNSWQSVDPATLVLGGIGLLLLLRPV